MAFTNPARQHGHAAERTRPFGPRAVFIACVLGIAVLWALLPGAVPQDLVIPTVVTAIFALGAVVALIASRLHASSDDVTYWDVAGAIILIGVCTAALIAPEQMARIVGTNSEN